MSNPQYGGWTKYTAFLADVTEDALDTSNVLNYVDIPQHCLLTSIEVQVSAAATAASLTLALYRDAAGDELFYEETAKNLTLGRTTATVAGAAWALERDHHPVAGISTEQTSALDASADSASSGNVVSGAGLNFTRIWYSLKCGADTATLERAIFNTRW